MVEAARARFPGETVALLMGGFHLLQSDESPLRAIAQRLVGLGVEKVAPTHCSGDLARAVFRDVFGTNCVEAGVGLTVAL